MYKIRIILCLLFQLYNHTVISQSIIINLDEALKHYVFKTRNFEIKHLEYKNEVLEHEVFKKSLLPSVKINFTPISFNRSMRLLQNFNTGEYSNVEEYSNMSNSEISVSYPIPFTGGKLTIGSAISHIYEFSTNTNNFNTRPFYISYQQKLFGDRKAYKYKKSISEEKQKIASKNFCIEIIKEQQVILNLFLEAYLAKLDQEHYEKALDVGDSLFQYAKIRRNIGKITEYEYNNIELQYIENKLNLHKAIYHKETCMRKLSHELQEDNIVLGNLGQFTFPDSIEYKQVLELSVRNHPLLQRIELNRINSEYDLYQCKINHGFNADISVSYGLNQYSKRINQAYINPNQQQAISILLNIPLLQWGANRNKIQIAKNNHIKNIVEQESTIHKFYEQIHDCVENYNRSRSMIEFSEKRYALSEKQYFQTIIQLLTGKVTAVELSNTEILKIQARNEYYSCLKDLYTSYFQLKEFTLHDFESNTDLIQTLLKW